MKVSDRAYEFVCCECGQGVVVFVKTNDFCLCATCIMLPGWHLDPTLRAKLGPMLPPLPEQSKEAAPIVTTPPPARADRPKRLRKRGANDP